MAGLFFKKNGIASRIVHLLEAFLWLKKKIGKSKFLFSVIYKSFLLSVTSTTAFRQGFNFKFAFKFRTFNRK